MKSMPNWLSALMLEGFSPAAKRRLIIGWLSIIIVSVLIFWLPGGLPPAPWRLLGSLLIRWGTLQPALGGGIFLPLISLLIQSVLLLIAWTMVGLAVRQEIAAFITLRSQLRVMRLRAALASTSDVAAAGAVSTKSQDLQVLPGANESSKSTGVQIVAPEDEEQVDQFDANMAVFELSPEPDEAKAEKETMEETSGAKDEEAVFIYGNPFEGELPDVFDYDMDLKREVQDLKSKMLAKQQNSTNAISANEQPAVSQPEKDQPEKDQSAEAWFADD